MNIVCLRRILLFIERGPEMIHRITWLCQSCDRDFLSNGLGGLGREEPKTRKLGMNLRPKTQYMQITSCLKPLNLTVPENNGTQKISSNYICCYYVQSGLKRSGKIIYN